MRLAWGKRNLEKVEAHGLSRAEVESAFDSEDWGTGPSDQPFRLVGEGTTSTGRLIRVVFAETDDGPYPITAFPIRTRQRRT